MCPPAAERPRAAERAAARRPAAPATRVVAAPAGARDVWWLLAVLAVVPLLLHSLGTPLGEPFADDFAFLRRALLPGPRSLWDGGGSPIYWRPLGRQVYFGAFGGLILSHPLIVPALHLGLLGASALLCHRALRRTWPATWAAVAAGFPLLLECSRMLIVWPSHFQNVGALVFAVLAVHEAAYARLWTMLAAILASLLCKEVGAVAALLVPWIPGAVATRRSWRLRATLATAGVVAAWGAVYLGLAARAGVGFGSQFGAEAAAAGTPAGTRVLWAFGNTLRSALSLAVNPGRWDTIAIASLVVLLAVAAAWFALQPAARTRLRAARALVVWGLAWFVAGTVPLIETYPTWSAERCVFACVGLGIALTGVLAAADPRLLVPFVALRLFTFGVSPGVTPGFTSQPPGPPGDFDIRHLARQQWFTHDVRALLMRRLPTLPPGTSISNHHLPAMIRHTLAGDLALQVWYRDTTLRWLPFEDYRSAARTPVAAFVEYQERGRHPLVLVDGAAMDGLFTGMEAYGREAPAEALRALDRAEREQRDTLAVVFLGTVAAKRALCQLDLKDWPGAERSARRGLELWPENPDSRYALAAVSYTAGDRAGAERLLLEQLALKPDDVAATSLLQIVRRDRVPHPDH